MAKLKYTLKIAGRGKWSGKARSTAQSAASCCDNIGDAVRYFNNTLAGMKRDSTGHIKDSYIARGGTWEDAGVPKGKALIYHEPAMGISTVIAEIEEVPA